MSTHYNLKHSRAVSNILVVALIAVFAAVVFGAFVVYSSKWVLIAISAFVGLVLAVAHPRAVLWIVLAVAPFIGVFRNYLGLHEFQIVPDLGLLFIVLLAFTNRLLSRELRVSNWPLLAKVVGLYFLLCLIWTLHPNVSGLQQKLNGLRLSGFHVLGFWAAWFYVKDVTFIRRFTKLLFAIAIIVAALGIVQHFFPPAVVVEELRADYARWHSSEGTDFGVFRDGRFRIVSTMVGPFHLSLFLMMVLLMFMSIFFYSKQQIIPTKWALFGFISALLCMLFNLTRTGWLGFIVGVASFSFLRRRGFIKTTGMLFLLGVVIVTLVLPAAERQVIAYRWSTVYNPRDAEVSQRLGCWLKGWSDMSRRPLFGSGLGVTRAGFYNRYGTAGVGNPHNQYLVVGIEMGVPVMLLYIVCVLLSVKQAFSVAKSSDSIYLRFFSTWAFAFFSSFFGFVSFFGGFSDAYPAYLYFWFMIGAVVKLRNVAGSSTTTKTKSSLGA